MSQPFTDQKDNHCKVLCLSLMGRIAQSGLDWRVSIIFARLTKAVILFQPHEFIG